MEPETRQIIALRAENVASKVMKDKVLKYKKEASNSKKALNAKVKEAYKKKLDAYKARVQELEAALKLADEQKEATIRNAKEEVEKKAARKIDSLKREHEDTLVKARDEDYAEAISATANEISDLKNIIYQVGYDLGL